MQYIIYGWKFYAVNLTMYLQSISIIWIRLCNFTSIWKAVRCHEQTTSSYRWQCINADSPETNKRNGRFNRNIVFLYRLHVSCVYDINALENLTTSIFCSEREIINLSNTASAMIAMTQITTNYRRCVNKAVHHNRAAQPASEREEEKGWENALLKNDSCRCGVSVFEREVRIVIVRGGGSRWLGVGL